MLGGMTLPAPHQLATHWGIERQTRDKLGELSWRWVSLSGGPGTGAPRHWFPIGSYTEEAVSQLGARTRVRVTFTTGPGIKHKLSSVDLDYTPAAAEPATKPAAPPTLHAPDILATAPPPALPLVQAIAQLTPREPSPKPLNGGPTDPGTLFERCHHLAHQDCAEVSATTTQLASAMLGAVSQMAGIVMATAGQRVADWQAMAASMMQQQQKPQPELQALAQAVQQLGAQQQQILAHLAELEADDDEPPQLPPAEPTDGQRMIAAFGPIAKELAPRVFDKLWPSDNPAAPQPRPPAGDTEAEP